MLLPDAQDVSIDILRAQLAPTLPDTDDDDCNAHRGHENVRFVAALPRLLAGIMHRVLVLCVVLIAAAPRQRRRVGHGGTFHAAAGRHA